MVQPLSPNLSSLVIITGANRGFGKALVLELAKYLISPSIFVLISRNANSIDDVALQIKAINPGHFIEKISLDFGSRNFSERVCEVVDFCRNLENVETQTLLIHNHGTFMSQYSTDIISGNRNGLDGLKHYLDVNLTHVAEFNALLIKALEGKWKTLGSLFFVVNVSSLAASTALPSWGPYCMAKSARHMMFSCLAIERPYLNVIQYSPGPLKTEMSDEVQSLTKDDKFRAESKSWSLLEPANSANKLIKVLNAGNFISGENVDFYDIE